MLCIQCFDETTEQYLTGDDCPYGDLATPGYGLGCTVMPSGALGKSAIVTVGGLETLSTDSSTMYSQSIEICRSDSKRCQLMSLTLEDGMLRSRVFAIDECHIGVVGGTVKVDGSEWVSDRIHIANLCELEWIENALLPLPLSEMGVIKTNGVFCLYGGVSYNERTFAPKLSTAAFCTDLGETRSPTTAPLPTRHPTPSPTPDPTMRPTKLPSSSPSHIPTSPPTLKPTSLPTIAGTGNVEFDDPSFGSEFATFPQGMGGQTGASDGDYLYVCGGYTDDATSFNQCYVYNEYGKQESLPMMLMNADSLLMPMPTFYCKNACSALYKNQLFFVNPTVNGAGSTDTHFYRCSVKLEDGHVLCTDLCQESNVAASCPELLHFESCATASGRYLYISGGYDSSGRVMDDISVFDMDSAVLDWVSVPRHSLPTFVGYPTSFGSLSRPVASHSCSYWNSSLYVIGGRESSGFSSSSIQICDELDPSSDCHVSAVTLGDARYNARSTVIGSSIVTVCGAKSNDEFSGTLEVYDAYFDELKSSAMWTNEARTACCLIDWESKSKLVISGGETRVGRTAATVDDMVFSEYTKSAVSSGTVEVEEQTALNCKHIVVDCRDYNFKAVYDFYNEINEYFIFATSDHTAYLVVDTTGTQKTWLYNYREKSSCFFNSPDGAVIELGPGVWTKPRTRESQTSNIMITLSCQSTLTAPRGESVALWGLTEAAFITMVVVAAVILMTILIIGFCCWWKKTETKQWKRAQRKSDRPIDRKDMQRLDTPRECEDEEVGDEFEDEEVGDDEEEEEDEDEDDEYGQHHEQYSDKGPFPVKIAVGKQATPHHYRRAPSYSSIRNHESNATLTIIRHIRTPSDQHGGYHQSKQVSLSDDSNGCGVEMQSGFSRIRSDSNPGGVDEDDVEEEEEDDEDMMITNDIIDQEDSTSTVFPFEVDFDAEDNNTKMLDQIAWDIKHQKERDRRKQSNRRQKIDSIPKMAGPARVYRFGSAHDS